MYFWNSIYEKYVHNRECVIIYYHPTTTAATAATKTATLSPPPPPSSSLTQLQSVLEVCLQCLPFRIGAIHICISKDDDNHDDTVNKIDNDGDGDSSQVPLFWKSLPPPLQIRTAIHCTPVSRSSSYGEQIHESYAFFQKELRRYGICTTPLEGTGKSHQRRTQSLGDVLFPVDSKGNVQVLKFHNEWLPTKQPHQQQKQPGDGRSSSSSSSPSSSSPSLLTMLPSADGKIITNQGQDRVMDPSLFATMPSEVASGASVDDPPVRSYTTSEAAASSSSSSSSAAAARAPTTNRFGEPYASPAAAPIFAAGSSAGTIIPTERDVLFGRGMNIQRHRGNVLFRRFLEGHVSRYYDADNVEKIVLIDLLFRKLQESGVRFWRHEMSSLGTFVTNNYYNPNFETSDEGVGRGSSSSPTMSSSRHSSTVGGGNMPSLFNVTSPGSATNTGNQIVNGRWVEVTDSKTIHSKFCQTFRSLKARDKKKSTVVGMELSGPGP
jgi:hypothetical protein